MTAKSSEGFARRLRLHLALRAAISEKSPISKDKSNATYSLVIAAERYHLVAAKLPSNCTHFFSTGTPQVSVSDNVKLMSWLPQNDILGHPKTRLFIGHAGINGILESTYHGVPMILAPFFGDQFYNANTMKQSGLAEVVNLWSMSSEEFVSLIQKVLSDPR